MYIIHPPSPNHSRPLRRNPPPRPHASLIQRILKRKQKRRRNHTLRHLRPHPLIQPPPPLLPHHPPKTPHHPPFLPSLLPSSYVHAGLHRDVGVGDACGGELPDGAEEEYVAGGGGAARGEGGEEAFEDGVLQDGVYDED